MSSYSHAIQHQTSSHQVYNPSYNQEELITKRKKISATTLDGLFFITYLYDGVRWKILFIFSISAIKTVLFQVKKSTFASVPAALRPFIMLASRGFTACDRKGNSAKKKRKLQPRQAWKILQELCQPENKDTTKQKSYLDLDWITPVLLLVLHI